MKKTEFKERVENACNVFFDDEFFDADDFLSCRDQEAFLQNEESKDFTAKNSTLETIFKQVFFFFPGTFVLYILSLVFTIMIISFFVRPTGKLLRFEFVGMLAVFLASTLMTWLGLGDVRKPKHLVIPASIISVGVFFGAIAAIASDHFSRGIFINGYPFYFLPLALIVPFLAKGWIDKKCEN